MLLCALFLFVFMGLSQANEDKESASVKPISTSIEVDGYLNEEIWRAAEPIDSFLRYLPTEGGEPSGTTQVYFLQDEKNL